MFGLFETATPTQAAHAVLGTPIDAKPAPGQNVAVFGCGCFWGAEKGFWRLPGVVTTAVGYAGGSADKPSYTQVCSGRSGHSEVVRVVWDTALVDLSDLLKLFWECHDPTQGMGQGNDRGTQYRSGFYYFDDDQKALIEASMKAYEAQLGRPITTEVAAASDYDQYGGLWFYGEQYHQQYLVLQGQQPFLFPLCFFYVLFAYHNHQTPFQNCFFYPFYVLFAYHNHQTPF